MCQGGCVNAILTYNKRDCYTQLALRCLYCLVDLQLFKDVGPIFCTRLKMQRNKVKLEFPLLLQRPGVTSTFILNNSCFWTQKHAVKFCKVFFSQNGQNTFEFFRLLSK